MAGFIYNGKSTKDILSSSELILCTFDGIDSVSGHQREDITGETTISRPIANEYGTQYEPLEIEYGLIKKDHTVITSEEQRTIEKWLTSPKISQELTVIDCQGNPIDGIYHGNSFQQNGILWAVVGLVLCSILKIILHTPPNTSNRRTRSIQVEPSLLTVRQTNWRNMYIRP